MKDPVVIQIAKHLPTPNTKVVPWNYNKVAVTQKEKKIVEETNEKRVVTLSVRFYALEELKRDKQIKKIIYR